jgi:hypothetical protein
MTLTGSQNPTLTYMAITARAANYAVEEMKKRNLQRRTKWQNKAGKERKHNLINY